MATFIVKCSHCKTIQTGRANKSYRGTWICPKCAKTTPTHEAAKLLSQRNRRSP